MDPILATILIVVAAVVGIAAGFIIGAALAVIVILVSAKIQNKLLSTEDIKNNFNIDIIATVSDIKNKNISQNVIIMF